MPITMTFLFLFLFSTSISLKIEESYDPPTPNSKLVPIMTEWGEKLDKDNVLKEYPRPQYVRNSYLNLNGLWDYALIDSETEPPLYDGNILVPFSIECLLSGVKDKSLVPGKTLWYKKYVDLTKMKNLGRMILNFGAVDQYTEVYINDKLVGNHDGGYNSFSFDITQFIGTEYNKVKITVKVKDNFDQDGAATGKQGNPRGGVYYARTGGIWQTVWIESVPETYIKNVKITPIYDDGVISFLPTIEGNIYLAGTITISDKEGQVIKTGVLQHGVETQILMPEDFEKWSPEHPYLYNVEYTYSKDNVKSYFAMRKFSIARDKKNIKRLFLNNKPYFNKGLLDQGYWSDGLYTAPSDEAIIYDIQTMKDLGFNMLRKHIKVEPMRWYYHCDRLGMIVWQDQVNGGKFPPPCPQGVKDSDYKAFGRESELGRKNYYRDVERTINQLYNVPCISTWTAFNEGWGQFDSVKAAEFIKSLDKTRMVDHASGGVDHDGPDFKSLHIYAREFHFDPDPVGRVIVLSEYASYGLTIPGHVGSDWQSSAFMFKTREEFYNAIKDLIEKNVLPGIDQGLAASVFTQVSDVEDEVNGLVTYDRKVLKVDKDKIKAINDKLVIE